MTGIKSQGPIQDGKSNGDYCTEWTPQRARNKSALKETARKIWLFQILTLTWGEMEYPLAFFWFYSDSEEIIFKGFIIENFEHVEK